MACRKERLVVAARKHKVYPLPAPPSDPHQIRVVPELALRFPEAYTARENERRQAFCRNRRHHVWVRSVNSSLKSKVMPDGAFKRWRVEESLVWCWDCGALHNVRHLEDVPISEAEYQELTRKPEPGYQGVEV